MENNKNPISTAAKGDSDGPDRAYTFVIIALGLLLVGMALFRPSVEKVTHQAVVEYTRESPYQPVGSLAESFQAELTSPATISRVLSQVPGRIHPVTGSERGSLNEQIAERIRVDLEPTAGDNTSHVRLTITGADEGLGYQLARLLLDEFVAKHTASFDLTAANNAFSLAKSEVARSIDELDMAQERLSEFEASRLAEEREAYDQKIEAYVRQAAEEGERGEDGGQAESQPAGLGRLATVQAVNPDWVDLQDELTELRLRQRSSHNVGDDSSDTLSEQTIRDLERRFGTTSEFIETSSTTLENPYVQSPAPPAETGDKPPATNVSASVSEIPRFDEFAARSHIREETEYLRLAATAEQLVSRRDAALTALRNTPDPTVLANETSTIIQDPRVVECVRRRFSTSHFLGILIPSVIIGMLCSWFRVEADPPESFISPTDVGEWLDLRIVGGVSTSDGPMIPVQATSKAPPVVRVVRRSAEVIVCVALLAVIFTVVSVSGVGRTFVSDPFTAYTQAIDHVTHLFS